MPHLKALATLLGCLTLAMLMAHRFPQYADGVGLAGITLGLGLAGRLIFQSPDRTIDP